MRTRSRATNRAVLWFTITCHEQRVCPILLPLSLGGFILHPFAFILLRGAPLVTFFRFPAFIIHPCYAPPLQKLALSPFNRVAGQFFGRVLETNFGGCWMSPRKSNGLHHPTISSLFRGLATSLDSYSAPPKEYAMGSKLASSHEESPFEFILSNSTC